MHDKTTPKSVKPAVGLPSDDVVAVWREISARLVPIIGRRGFAALYNRSLHALSVDHPYLTTVHQSAIVVDDYAALQAVLKLQSDAQAQAVVASLLQSFYDRLSHLVGDSFTDRLIRPILENHASGIAALKVHHDQR